MVLELVVMSFRSSRIDLLLVAAIFKRKLLEQQGRSEKGGETRGIKPLRPVILPDCRSFPTKTDYKKRQRTNRHQQEPWRGERETRAVISGVICINSTSRRETSNKAGGHRPPEENRADGSPPKPLNNRLIMIYECKPKNDYQG